MLLFLETRRYPDTKHNLVSFSITALKEVEITAAVELLHGMYYSDFDTMLDDVGELFVFTPGRSDYKPLEPSRKSFFFLLDKGDFSDLRVNCFACTPAGTRLATCWRRDEFMATSRIIGRAESK